MDSSHSAAGKEPDKQGKGLQEKNQASVAFQKEIDQQTKSWEAFNTPRLQSQKSDLEKRKEGLVSLLNELTLLREKQISLNTLQETEQKIFNQLITVQQEQEISDHFQPGQTAL